jgi:hypothetical protein
MPDLGAMLVGFVVLTAVLGAAGVAVGILLIGPAITRRMDREDEAQEPGDRDG